MKIMTKTTLAIALAGLFAVAAQAQTNAPKIGIVNMATLFDNHYETVAQKAQLEADMQAAEKELQTLNQQGQALVEEVRKIQESAKNPALADSAKQKLEADFQVKVQALQAKQQEVNNFRATTQRAVQERTASFRQLLVGKINEIVKTVASGKGLNIVFDASGNSFNLMPTLVYTNGVVDITGEVQALINKDKPADAPSAAPSVTFPGAKK
ncbi:MAG: OmpH family outer membrane protein [Opitutaceae bacterium]|jgi:outer membrane protein|nr:OmpH family outer membrane protein [Opitutaceae bacterium]